MASQLKGLDPPVIFEAALQSRRLVSAEFAHVWAIPLPDESGQLFQPRVWLDIHGQLVESLWRDSLIAVLSCLHMEPCQSEVSLLYHRL